LSVRRVPYRESPRAEPDPYVVAWAQYRRRRARVRALLLISPLVGCLALAALRASACGSGAAHGVALGLAIAIVVLATFSIARASCPRCGEKLHVGGSHVDPFSDRCVNCGIRIGTPKSSC
jgi:hypothetical protein